MGPSLNLSQSQNTIMTIGASTLATKALEHQNQSQSQNLATACHTAMAATIMTIGKSMLEATQSQKQSQNQSQNHNTQSQRQSRRTQSQNRCWTGPDNAT